MRLLIASEQCLVCQFHEQLSEYYIESQVGGVLWGENQLLSSLGRNELWGHFEEELLVVIVALREDTFNFHIDYLATVPKSLGKGFMSNVFRELVDKSQVQSKSIWLEVSDKNQSACRLYKKFLFQRVGGRVNYYKNGDNALLYTYNP